MHGSAARYTPSFEPRRPSDDRVVRNGLAASGHEQTQSTIRGMKSSSPNGGLVYSTDAGRMCPVCRKAIAQCACSTLAPAAPSDGIVRISRETKGRGGKAVTVVRGLASDPATLATLAKQLKAACGSGGTVKDGAVEVQGDHRSKIATLLIGQGRKVKQAGG